MFGEMSALLDKPHTANVLALTTARFHIADADTLLAQDRSRSFMLRPSSHGVSTTPIRHSLISCTIGDLNFCVGHDRRALLAAVHRALNPLISISLVSCLVSRLAQYRWRNSPEKEFSRQERHQEYENSGAGLPIYINGHVGGH